MTDSSSSETVSTHSCANHKLNVCCRTLYCGLLVLLNIHDLFFISGRGIPNVLRSHASRPIIPVSDRDFPPADSAAALYRQQFGGTLTDPSYFANSPFRSDAEAQLCNTQFSRHVPDLTTLLDSAVNRNYVPFNNALLKLIELTQNICD